MRSLAFKSPPIDKFTMARKKILSEAKNAFPDKKCRDCANSYDWHSEAIDGHLILCRCKHRKEGGKYCVFLRDPACELFVQRKEDKA